MKYICYTIKILKKVCCLNVYLYEHGGVVFCMGLWRGVCVCVCVWCVSGCACVCVRCLPVLCKGERGEGREGGGEEDVCKNCDI